MRALSAAARLLPARSRARRSARYRDDTYWGRPVPGFGDPEARLLLVGLAPAAHGANRTGRVFTGDGAGGSGDFLMSALHRTGFANIPTSQHVDDGLALRDAFILAAVRCAPPDNKPLPEEITRCLDHLDAELAHCHASASSSRSGRSRSTPGCSCCGAAACAISPRPQFGARQRRSHTVAAGSTFPTLIGCYHPSRQNTQTGKLTAPMLERRVQRSEGDSSAERTHRTGALGPGTTL